MKKKTHPCEIKNFASIWDILNHMLKQRPRKFGNYWIHNLCTIHKTTKEGDIGKPAVLFTKVQPSPWARTVTSEVKAGQRCKATCYFYQSLSMHWTQVTHLSSEGVNCSTRGNSAVGLIQSLLLALWMNQWVSTAPEEGKRECAWRLRQPAWE